MIKKSLVLCALLFVCVHLRAQLKVYSFEKHISQPGNSFQRFMKHPQGNMWMIGFSHHWSVFKSYDFQIGRAWQEDYNEGGPFGVYDAYGWGFGVERMYRPNNENDPGILYKAFLHYEAGSFPGIINPQVRLEFLSDFSGHSYLRPSVAWSLYFLDVGYSYNFLLADSQSWNGHMFTLRLKTYLGKNEYYSKKKE